MCQFSSRKENFDYFDLNLPKNGFCGQNFKNLSLDSESVPPIYHMFHFSVRIGNFKIFGINFAKLPIYMRYFGSNNNEGVKELGGG